MRRPALLALRLALYALAFVFGALLVIALGDVLYSSGLRELRPWHGERLEGEFRASAPDRARTLAEYRAREDALFAQVQALRARHFDAARDGSPSRYNPRGSPFVARLDRDWNRSYVLAAPAPKAVALLLHGLSDSPYSLRSIALALQANGVSAYGLRLPGHGTLPGELDRADWPDWHAAAKMALADLRVLHPGLPVYVVGYSTGAALAIKAAVDAVIAGRETELPRKIFLLSPALGVTPFARLANVQRIVTSLGIGRKSRWGNVDLEIDPYKYQSFAKNAGAQVALLVAELDAALGRLRDSGRAAALPRILSFQSVVDETVSTADLIDRLYAVVDNPASELVLFDVNRAEGIEPFLTFSPQAVIDAFRRQPHRNWRLSIVTNARPDTREVAEQSLRAGASKPEVRPLPFLWPDDVFSLSHVALPFPPDDPVYGDRATGPDGPLVTLGTLRMRGEKNVLSIPAAEHAPALQPVPRLRAGADPHGHRSRSQLVDPVVTTGTLRHRAQPHPAARVTASPCIRGRRRP